MKQKTALCLLVLIAALGCQSQAPDPTTAAPTAAAPTSEPTSAPALDEIVFVSQRSGSSQLFAMNSDGSAQTQLTFLSSQAFFPEPAPDGSSILFWNYDASTSPATFGLQFYYPDGSTDDFGLALGWSSWSPDKSSIAISLNPDGTNFEVGLVVGSSLTFLTDNASNDLQPDFSPDGETIAFATERDGLGQIYLMNTDGSDQRRLDTGDLYANLPDWSPDGSQIAFVGTIGESTQIFVMDADGGNLTQLTDAADSYNEDPSWSPDGSKIVFWSSRTGDHEIFVMGADGGNQVNISNNPGSDDENPTWLPSGTNFSYVN